MVPVVPILNHAPRTAMKSSSWILAITLVSLAGYASAAKPEKRKPKLPPPSAGLSEVLKPFDKNADGRIDGDELQAVRKTYSGLAKLDKNTNGEIDQTEVPTPPPAKAKGAPDRGKRFGGLRTADKNGNHKIDPDEVEGLQQALIASGGDLMAKIDRNKNGKLDTDEVSRINERLGKGHGAKGKKPSAAPTKTSNTPSTTSPTPVEPAKSTEAAKPAETVKAAEKVELPKSTNSDATKKPEEKK